MTAATYADFAAALKPGGRGGRRQLRVINEAPGGIGAMGDLREYLLGLDEQELAGGWVACVVGAAIEDPGHSAGDLNRVLLVVAERLHGVTWEGGPLSAEDLGMSAFGRATPKNPHLIQDTPRGAGLALDGRRDASGPSGSGGGGGFQWVTSAEAPPPKKARLDHPLLMAVMNITSQEQVIVVDPAKIDKALVRKIVSAAVKNGKKDANWYEAADGRIVVGIMPGRKRGRGGGRKPKNVPAE